MDRQLKTAKYSASSRCFCAVLFLLFVFSIIPILVTAFFAVPQVDDFYYSIKTHSAFMQEHNLFAIISAAGEQVVKTYNDWQGTWSAVFLFALQPGIYGEDYYFISTFVLIFTFIGATFLFARTILGRVLKFSKHQYIICTLLILLAQIQALPSALQAFFWWNGSIYYTFFYSLSLVLFSLIAIYLMSDSKKAKTYSFIGACLTAAIISGGNYVTALLTLLVLCIISAWYIYKRDKRFIPLLVITAVFVLGFAVSVMAPGNAVRAARYDSGHSAIEAIIKSFSYSFWRVYSATDIVFMLCMLLLSPFICINAERSELKFKHPIIFALVTFCLFVSQFTPPLYGMGDMNEASSARIVNIIYFSYYWLIAANIYYIWGYVSHKHGVSVKAILTKLKKPKALMSATLLIAVLMFMLTFTFDGNIYNGLKFTSPNAIQSLLLGQTQDFNRQWEERFEMLHDDDLKNVVFEPITSTPKLLYYGDLTGDSEYEWSNLPMKLYYNKSSVITDWS